MMPTCDTCPHACKLSPGQLGLCRARRGGADGVRGESYGRITSLALDPIEKKPIARWMAGSMVLSLGSYGCNMRCPFCQNASIAQVGPEEVPWRPVMPQEVIGRALDMRAQGCVGIAFTYNEPLISWEFVRDTAALAREAGLVNVLVSNGMVSASVLDELSPLIDAANIDLKCFTEKGYRSLGGDLETVKHTIAALAASPRCHLEVTTLVVPGLSDDEEQVENMTAWLAGLDPSIPYHLTRFFPMHEMKHADATPLDVMRRLASVASRHIGDVLLGNM